MTSVPNKIVFARKPKKPKKPAVKPAAPTAAKPTSGVKIKILGQFGSAVKFRGKLYSSGDTKTLVVQPGAYSAEIIPSCTGCLPRTHRFNVTPEGKSLFKFPPAFQDATLVVRAVPSNATIIFRGKPMRSGTPVNIKMRRPRETFVVKVSAPGYQPTNRGVKVTTATRTEVTVTLQR